MITKERPKRVSTRAVYSARCQYIVEVYPNPEALSTTFFTSFKNAASEAEHYATSHHARVVYVEDQEPMVLADYHRRALALIDPDDLASGELHVLSSREGLAVMAKESARKRSSQPRELIDTGRDKRYVKRTANGRSKESADVSKSLPQDRRRRAKRSVKSGHGDQGDRRAPGSKKK